MILDVTDVALSGIKLICPRAFHDDRGYFLELHHASKFAAISVDTSFVQDNLSCSRRDVLRGLHFQCPDWQAKLVSVIRGEVFDVAVDLRKGSATFGRSYCVVLSDENRLQLYVPEGFAHGFCVLSETAYVLYKCSRLYNPEQEQTLRWDDPALTIAWPVRNPMLSDKDARGRLLKDLQVPD